MSSVVYIQFYNRIMCMRGEQIKNKDKNIAWSTLWLADVNTDHLNNSPKCSRLKKDWSLQ